MSEEDLEQLLESCKSVPVMMIGGCTGASPQENANRAWQRLGEKMGFDYMTVRPIDGKGQCFFSAVPTENETQKGERLKREAEEKRLSEIKRLEDEIKERQARLSEYREGKE
jgi:hypothetical protein